MRLLQLSSGLKNWNIVSEITLHLVQGNPYSVSVFHVAQAGRPLRS